MLEALREHRDALLHDLEIVDDITDYEKQIAHGLDLLIRWYEEGRLA